MTARVRLLVRREVSAAVQARWFAAYAAVFLLAGLLLAAFGAGDSAIHGYRGFAKAFAGLMHLALLFVPLMALLPAAAAIAAERESGALEYVLAQPVSFGEVYLGKWVGTAAAVVLALAAGFAFTGLIAVLQGVPAGLAAALHAFVALLALDFVALGLLVSGAQPSRTRATTVGIITWLVLVTLGTLGLMIAFVRWGLPADVLVTWSFVNPVEAFRVGVLSLLDPDLSVLGPVGAKVIDALGTTGTALAAAAALAAWAVVPGVVGLVLFRRG